MSNRCKIFVKEDGSLKEIRQFFCDMSSWENLSQAVEKFLCLENKKYKILYKDADGDLISLYGPHDLSAARSHWLDLTVHVLEVHIESTDNCQKKQPDVIHTGVVCDGCDAIDISGYRYKCLECDDYDLCMKCEAAGIHSDHFMLRIPKQLVRSLPRYFRHLHKNAWKLVSDGDRRGGSSCRHESRSGTCHKSESRKGRLCPGLEDWDMDVLKEQVKEVANLFGINLDLRFEPNEDASMPKNNSKANDTATDAKPDADSTKHETTEKHSNKGTEVVDEQLSTTSASDTASSDAQPAKADIATDDWTILEEASSSRNSPVQSLDTENNSKETQTKFAATAPPLGAINEPAEPRQRIRHSDPKIQESLNTLLSMGFAIDDSILIYLLETCKGNLNEVLKIIMGE